MLNSELNRGGAAIVQPDADYVRMEVARYGGLKKALLRGEITFETTSSLMRTRVPTLTAVETAEIERQTRSIIVEELRHGSGTAVVFNNQRLIVHTMEFGTGETPKHILKSIAAAAKAGEFGGGTLDSDAAYEIYLMPLGTYGAISMLAYKRGVALGEIRTNTAGKIASRLGIKREFEIAYRPKQRPPLEDLIDTAKAHRWSSREIARALDRLAAQLLWFGELRSQLDAPNQQQEADPRSAKEALPDAAERCDEICVRIFSLGALLIDRKEHWLLTGCERDAARRCGTLDLRKYEFLSERTLVGWTRYMAEMINPEARKFGSSPVRSDQEVFSSIRNIKELQTQEASSARGSESGNTVVCTVFDGNGQSVAKCLFSPAEGRETILNRTVEALRPRLKPMSQRYNETYYEAYITSSACHGVAAARKEGSAIGFVSYNPKEDLICAELVDECGADFGYPLQDDIFLGENLIAGDVSAWSTRRVLHCLDRLMEEHWFIDAHGLMAPVDDVGAVLSRSHDASIRNELQRHARVSDRIWTRILALCDNLMTRGRLHLVSDCELDFALNCNDVEKPDHPGVSNYVIVFWDEILAQLEASRFIVSSV
jgi:hypothetical protein